MYNPKKFNFGPRRPIEKEYVVYTHIEGEAKFYVTAANKKEALNMIFNGRPEYDDSEIDDWWPVKKSAASIEEIR